MIPMKVFRLDIEFCLTGIARYGFKVSKHTSHQEMRLIPEPDNKYDSNAIQVYIGDKLVGYVKATDAIHLSRMLMSNMYVKKWGILTYTSGYAIIHAVLKMG